MLVKKRHHTIFWGNHTAEGAPSVTMPTSLDSSKLCFWRLYSNAWIKSDPFTWTSIQQRPASSSNTSKSHVTQRAHYFRWFPRTHQQPVNSKHTCRISREVEFQHLKYQLPAFVLSSGSNILLQHMRAAWKFRGLAAVRRCYAERGCDFYAKL